MIKSVSLRRLLMRLILPKIGAGIKHRQHVNRLLSTDWRNELLGDDAICFSSNNFLILLWVRLELSNVLQASSLLNHINHLLSIEGKLEPCALLFRACIVALILI